MFRFGDIADIFLAYFKKSDTKFQSYYRQSSTIIVRIGFGLAIFLYAVFAILDQVHMPETRNYAWLIRFAFVLPSLVIILIISFYPIFQRAYNLFISIGVLFCGGGILAMIALSREHELGYQLYFNGLYLVIIWIYGLMRLPMALANILSFSIVFVYLLIASFIQKIFIVSPGIILGNMFFLVSSIIIGMISGVLMEEYSHRDYIQKEKIKFVNSHHLRAPIARMLGILDSFSHSIKTENEHLREWLYILASSSKDIDSYIHELQSVLSESPSKLLNEEKKDENIGSDKLFEKVYLIDDDKFCNMISQKIISKCFPELPIVIFSDAREALKSLENENEKLILIFLDINMPEMNGFQFLESCIDLKNTPFIVMLSSSIDENDKLKSFSFKNVTAYISKPLKTADVEKLIKGRILN